jgi:UDP-3-O-[3-hydroxymyristoyl] glucosamine N-acyltransferase
MRNIHTQIPLQAIIEFLGADVKQVLGVPQNVFINNLRPSDKADSHTLDWISPGKNHPQEVAEASNAQAIIVPPDVPYSKKLEAANKVLVIHDNPKLAILRVGNAFFVSTPVPGVHSTAVIDPDAELGNSIFVGAHALIGKCIIGDNVQIYPNVVVNDDVIIGNNVIVKAGAVLGFDGFGYEKDVTGALIKFPQIGQLIIHDNVEIGSNTCIDRGSLGDTIIGRGTKVNNLCHIAHNSVIGRNVIITAQVNISGSTTIEDNVWIAPNASFRGHQTIGKGAVIGMGAIVTKNVPAGETWVGNPARKLGE